MIKFVKCMHCGNVAQMVVDSGVKMVCCGEPMHELVANTTEAAVEKHLPVCELNGNELKVIVGSVVHPMSEAHSIRLIAVVNGDNVYEKLLSFTEEPVASFVVDSSKSIEVYEYCNLHGLWKTIVK